MFDLSGVKTNNFEALPAGKYTCYVTSAELKDTKSGTGQYIKMELTVQDDFAEGRKIFTQINVKNDNPKAVEIGLQTLRALLENAGYKDPNKLESVSELCGLRVGVKTKLKTDEYGEKAEVSYYFKPNPIKEKVGQDSPPPASW